MSQCLFASFKVRSPPRPLRWGQAACRTSTASPPRPPRFLCDGEASWGEGEQGLQGFLRPRQRSEVVLLAGVGVGVGARALSHPGQASPRGKREGAGEKTSPRPPAHPVPLWAVLPAPCCLGRQDSGPGGSLRDPFLREDAAPEHHPQDPLSRESTDPNSNHTPSRTLKTPRPRGPRELGVTGPHSADPGGVACLAQPLGLVLSDFRGVETASYGQCL